MKRLLLLMLVFTASSAQGEIYTWIDARGAQHYTNRLDDIPVRYRAKSKGLNYGTDPQAGTSSPQQHDLSQPAGPAPDELRRKQEGARQENRQRKEHRAPKKRQH